MADFPYNPDFGYKVNSKFATVRTKMENGVEQRRLVHGRKLRDFQLPFSNRNTTEMDAAKAFFDLKNGSTTAFTISIEGADVLGVFQEDSFVHTRTGPNSWSYEFTFEEVIL